MWNSDLIRLVQECRAMNYDMRFGQLLFNAISLHDQANYTSAYDCDFHSRLFTIYDEELVRALKEWFEFVEQQKNNKNTSS